ncbi:MAG TPA: hypothetical protein VG897_05925, partial [Terriglobales bacterium]|nr:hypothetical protein [Terriglobales bacterium]
MKRFSSNLQAFCSIAALAGGSVATYYILGPRLQRPMVSACATIMLVPPVLWLFLLIIKRD